MNHFHTGEGGIMKQGVSGGGGGKAGWVQSIDGASIFYIGQPQTAITLAVIAKITMICRTDRIGLI